MGRKEKKLAADKRLREHTVEVAYVFQSAYEDTESIQQSARKVDAWLDSKIRECPQRKSEFTNAVVKFCNTMKEVAATRKELEHDSD